MHQGIRVAKPPSKPLMIFDDDCNFCRRWIARWRRATGDRVEYLAARDPRVAAEFPEIPRENFTASVQLIERDGSVYGGAEAVFRSLAVAPHRRGMLWAYRRVPGVASVTEWFYRLVATHRN